MNARWREWVVVLCGLASILVPLNSALAGSWTPLLYASAVVVFGGLIVLAKCQFYLAFGLLAPFCASLVLVKQVPTLALALIVCMIAIGLRAIVKRRGIPYMGRIDPLIMIFYLYLIVRYACDPVLPGYALGLSDDVTGFRSWLDHMIGLMIFLCLGFIITSREDVQRLFHWLAVMSVVFAIVFIVLMFVPGKSLTTALNDMGIFQVMFENGWRRFVFLPYMGIYMIMAYFLPALFRTTSGRGWFLLGLGLVAIVAGGNRASFYSMLIMLVVTWTLKRRYLALAGLFAAVIAMVILSNVLLQKGMVSSENPLSRIMSSVNPKMAVEIGVMDPVEWRIIRWKRAIEDIKQYPWVGTGYGGLNGYFRMLSDVRETSADLDVDRDLATGNTHNGYISAARNLGIPIALLFIIIVIVRMLVHWRNSRFGSHSDVILSEANIFLCAYLAMILGVLMTGAEIRTPSLWVFIVLSLIVERLDSELSRKPFQVLNKDVTA